MGLVAALCQIDIGEGAMIIAEQNLPLLEGRVDRMLGMHAGEIKLDVGEALGVPAAHFDEKRLILLDPVSQYALVAAREALAQSGLTFDEPLADRTAVVIGTGIGGATTQDQMARRLYGEGNPRVHPMAIVRVMPNAPASQISLEFGLRGPAFAVASACASANHALGQALLLKRTLVRFLLRFDLVHRVRGALQALHEAVDLARGVDDALLARVERVALRANVDLELRRRRANSIGVPARADDARFGVVLGMDFFFHDLTPQLDPQDTRSQPGGRSSSRT
jgi:hypothetical protein